MQWERTDYDAMSRVYNAGRVVREEWVAERRTALEPWLATKKKSRLFP